MPFTKGYTPWNKGKSPNKKTREKMSVAAKKRKPSFLGKKHTKETKEKISNSKKGQVSPWKNKTPNKKAREKMRIAKLGIRGPEHWNWKGTATERHLAMGRSEYIEWRSMVFERDKYTCQKCGAKGVYLQAHHKKSWANYPNLRYNLSNGVTLCEPCHAKVDKYYANFYKEVVYN